MKHEPNEVAFGKFNTGKPGSVDLHPGSPQREVKTGKVGTSTFPNSPTDREKAGGGNRSTLND